MYYVLILCIDFLILFKCIRKSIILFIIYFFLHLNIECNIIFLLYV